MAKIKPWANCRCETTWGRLANCYFACKLGEASLLYPTAETCRRLAKCCLIKSAKIWSQTCHCTQALSTSSVQGKLDETQVRVDRTLIWRNEASTMIFGRQSNAYGHGQRVGRSQGHPLWGSSRMVLACANSPRMSTCWLQTWLQNWPPLPGRRRFQLHEFFLQSLLVPAGHCVPCLRYPSHPNEFVTIRPCCLVSSLRRSLRLLAAITFFAAHRRCSCCQVFVLTCLHCCVLSRRSTSWLALVLRRLQLASVSLCLYSLSDVYRVFHDCPTHNRSTAHLRLVAIGQ